METILNRLYLYFIYIYLYLLLLFFVCYFLWEINVRLAVKVARLRCHDKQEILTYSLALFTQLSIHFQIIR